MADKYTVEVGIDGSGINKNLEDAISLLNQTEKKAKEATANMEKAFREASKGSENLNNNIKEGTKQLEENKKKADEAGKTLRTAFDVKEVGELEKKISDFKTKVDDVSAKRKIEIEVDSKAIEEIKAVKEELMSDYDGIQEQLRQRAEALSTYSSEAGENIVFIKEQIKQLEEELKGKAPSTSTAEMLSELKNQHLELEAQIELYDRYSNELKTTEQAQKQLTSSLATATQEIKRLEGASNELNEEQKKVEASGTLVGAMLGQVDTMTGGAITKFKDLQGVLKMTVTGLNGVKVALIGTGIGAFIVLLGTLIAYFKTSEEGQDKFAKYMNIIGSVVGNVMDVLSDFGELIIWVFENPQEAMTALGDMIKENITNRITGLMELIPQLGKAMKLVFKGEFSEAAEVATNALAKVALGQDKIVDKFREMGQAGSAWAEQLRKDAEEAGKISDLLADATVKNRELVIDQAKANRDIALLREQATQKDLYSAKQRENMLLQASKIEDEISKKRIEVAKMQAEAQTRQNALSKSTTEDLDKEAEANAKVIELEAERARNQRKIQRELQSARAESAREGAEARKKREEEEKKTLEKIIELTRAFQDSELSMQKDSLQKLKQEMTYHYDREIEDLKRQKLTTKAEIDARNKLVEQLEKEKNKKLLQLEEDYQKEFLKMQIDFKAILAGLQKESLTADLAMLEADHEARKIAITEQFKDQADLQKQLLNALEASTERERLKIRNDWANKSMKEEEERAVLSIELMSKYAKKTEQTEHQKQLAILNVKKDYASKYLKTLIDNGNAEDSIEVLRAKKIVQDIDEALKEESDKGSKFDFFEFIGLGELDGKQRDLVKKSVSSLADNVRQMTDFIVDQYDRQIDKKKELIAVYDNDISDLEGRLEREKELQEQGFANDVDIIQQEIDAKKQQRDEELLAMQELQKKKQKMQKVQFAMDTIMQTQNLITASTDIFKSLASIPFVGVPLAIALIGTMFGAFAMTKIKASQIANQADLDAYESGGLIKGKRHSQGGEKYYSKDGTKVKELEDNEFVTNRIATAKHLPLLEAINYDDFQQVRNNDRYLKQLFSDLGISFQEDSSFKTLKLINEAKNEFNLVFENKNESKDTKKMIQVLELIHSSAKDTVQTWEDSIFRYTRKGNKISKVRKWKNTDIS